jgi:hypothetical protein
MMPASVKRLTASKQKFEEETSSKVNVLFSDKESERSRIRAIWALVRVFSGLNL